ncbi:cytochrome c oxidase cbb3-type subunit 3 [Octadecabacter temperatus]|uniref:Cbb3-type cytochrome c oxidase subunit n=1 Tax=Octadecabacter temperatus TaxID=1458307 RepID=A0A0K0Y203_9RHOB|nr:cytochrome-c oxidase, cbb3-type subunit III [Octadecabacter temperatus]AKS44963.1 Cbb3-type cytochrome c oxidase subunit CcoP [Octadecabacter temperatus]SIN83502.1 cytochrome c oxidase cbb3-type subunit 3 [Octadecabacter temperatus]
MSERKIDDETGVETTGHSWDGIEELNNPLPRWWLWTLYACIVWAMCYTIAYPAWPMISGATQGMLGFSTRGQVAADIVDHEAKNEALVAELVAADLTTLPPSSDLHRYAVARGGSVFRAQCSQCHGSGAAGAVGYPNLLDNDWLWGGDIENISATITHGVRNDTDLDARYSEMPAYGDIFAEEEIEAVVEFVASLSSTEFDTDLAQVGSELFLDNCAACHGDEGLGDQMLGAPNLADAIWLYGGDRDTLAETVTNARFGVMPAWGQRLSDVDVRAVSVYVHALGGGE